MAEAKEKCPWCGSEISRKELARLEARIREDEGKRHAAAETELRQQLEAEKAELVRQLTARAHDQLAAVTAELGEAKAAREALEAERKDLARRAEEQVAARVAEIHTALAAEARERQDEADAGRREAEEKLRRLLAAEATREKTELKEAFRRERETLLQRIDELSTQIKRSTGAEVEPLTIDLLEELRAAFPRDEISLMHRGQAAEKIVVRVTNGGEQCGSILIDGRCRGRWGREYLSALHDEQVKVGAEYAVFATTVFPRNRTGFFRECDVLVAHPSAITDIVDVLRQGLRSLHRQELSTRDRSEKMDRLYRFICSGDYARKRDEAATLTGRILDLDVAEKAQHDRTWRERGALLIRLRAALDDIRGEIGSIIDGSADKRSRRPHLAVVGGTQQGGAAK
jgi:hypothetical protein